MTTPINRAAEAILTEAGFINNPSVQNDLTAHPAITTMYAKRYARAALLSLIEPTEVMIKAGRAEGYSYPGGVVDFGAVWTAMLSAALEEKLLSTKPENDLEKSTVQATS